MDDLRTKLAVIDKIRNMGFYIENLGRSKYLVNNTFVILLKYSRIYYNKNKTWFALSQLIFIENRIDYIFFIIQDSESVLVTPFNAIQDISSYYNPSGINSRYQIYIDPVNFFVDDTYWNLYQYLNQYNQLRI